LVVVLDGLDEASDPRNPGSFAFPEDLLPRALGERTAVVLAARASASEDPAAWFGQRLGVPLQHFTLPELDAQAVARLLAQAKRPDLNARAGDPAFVERILRNTGGLAIYLRFLVDELDHAQPGDWDRIVDQLPRHFREFVSQTAAVGGDHRAWQVPFRFLALAKGPLSGDDLMALTRGSQHPLQ